MSREREDSGGRLKAEELLLDYLASLLRQYGKKKELEALQRAVAAVGIGSDTGSVESDDSDTSIDDSLDVFNLDDELKASSLSMSDTDIEALVAAYDEDEAAETDGADLSEAVIAALVTEDAEDDALNEQIQHIRDAIRVAGEAAQDALVAQLLKEDTAFKAFQQSREKTELRQAAQQAAEARAKPDSDAAAAARVKPEGDTPEARAVDFLFKVRDDLQVAADDMRARLTKKRAQAEALFDEIDRLEDEVESAEKAANAASAAEVRKARDARDYTDANARREHVTSHKAQAHTVFDDADALHVEIMAMEVQLDKVEAQYDDIQKTIESAASLPAGRYDLAQAKRDPSVIAKAVAVYHAYENESAPLRLDVRAPLHASSGDQESLQDRMARLNKECALNVQDADALRVALGDFDRPARIAVGVGPARFVADYRENERAVFRGALVRLDTPVGQYDDYAADMRVVEMDQVARLLRQAAFDYYQKKAPKKDKPTDIERLVSHVTPGHLKGRQGQAYRVWGICQQAMQAQTVSDKAALLHEAKKLIDEIDVSAKSARWLDSKNNSSLSTALNKIVVENQGVLDQCSAEADMSVKAAAELLDHAAHFTKAGEVGTSVTLSGGALALAALGGRRQALGDVVQTPMADANRLLGHSMQHELGASMIDQGITYTMQVKNNQTVLSCEHTFGMATMVDHKGAKGVGAGPDENPTVTVQYDVPIDVHGQLSLSQAIAPQYRVSGKADEQRHRVISVLQKFADKDYREAAFQQIAAQERQAVIERDRRAAVAEEEAAPASFAGDTASSPVPHARRGSVESRGSHGTRSRRSSLQSVSSVSIDGGRDSRGSDASDGLHRPIPRRGRPSAAAGGAATATAGRQEWYRVHGGALAHLDSGHIGSDLADVAAADSDASAETAERASRAPYFMLGDIIFVSYREGRETGGRQLIRQAQNIKSLVTGQHECTDLVHVGVITRDFRDGAPLIASMGRGNYRADHPLVKAGVMRAGEAMGASFEEVVGRLEKNHSRYHVIRPNHFLPDHVARRFREIMRELTKPESKIKYSVENCAATIGLAQGVRDGTEMMCSQLVVYALKTAIHEEKTRAESVYERDPYKAQMEAILAIDEIATVSELHFHLSRIAAATSDALGNIFVPRSEDFKAALDAGMSLADFSRAAGAPERVGQRALGQVGKQSAFGSAGVVRESELRAAAAATGPVDDMRALLAVGADARRAQRRSTGERVGSCSESAASGAGHAVHTVKAADLRADAASGRHDTAAPHAASAVPAHGPAQAWRTVRRADSKADLRREANQVMGARRVLGSQRGGSQ